MTRAPSAAEVCLFSTYFTAPAIPPYVKRYLEELRRHFGRIVVITNDDKTLGPAELDWLRSRSLELLLVKNEGYDFGMWYKALQHLGDAPLERLALINDSCVLFTSLADTLQWMDRSPHTVCGLVDSNQIAYHLQSYFLYIKREAIPDVRRYFTRQGIPTGGFWGVVHTYEIGMSVYLNVAGHSLGARYSFRRSGFPFNPSVEFVEPLIKAGMPMIKRKVLGLAYGRASCRPLILSGFDPDPRHYVRLIRDRHGLSEPDVQELFNGSVAQAPGQRIQLAWWKAKYGLYRALNLRRNLRLPEGQPFVVSAAT